MALKSHALLQAPIIELDTIDSTNNYAMQLIDADTAQEGMTIVTRLQTMGKGQRGRQWQDVAGESLLMSIVIEPVYPLSQQFCFNMAVALSIAEVLQNLYENWDVRIKWPNDIIINDKKAGGILIENVIRGSKWAYSVIGIGINVQQSFFGVELPFATSLGIESGKHISVKTLMKDIRTSIIKRVSDYTLPNELLHQFNSNLYRKDQIQHFAIDDREFKAYVIGATMEGQIRLQHEDGTVESYNHGDVQWLWGH